MTVSICMGNSPCGVFCVSVSSARTDLIAVSFASPPIAATTFAAEKGDVFHRRGFVRWLAIIIIVLSLTGAALCLFVSEISYPFFHFVECTGSDTLDFSNEISRLATLVEWRTSYYRLAWTCSIVAIPLFLVLFWVSLNWEKQPKPPN